jgi:3-hydroxypropanoate dehydrogenase
LNPNDQEMATMSRVEVEVLRQAFLDARTHNGWQPKEVPDSLLRELVEMALLGPTATNSLPARFVFVKSTEAKEKLKPHLSDGNKAKTMAAPVCVIIGYDTAFYEHMHRTFPHKDLKGNFAANPKLAEEVAFRNGSLQGAYLIIAARLLGLDCGPMSGFSNAGVDEAFFAGTTIKSNFLCNLGYGDGSVLKARLPRLGFDEVAGIA